MYKLYFKCCTVQEKITLVTLQKNFKTDTDCHSSIEDFVKNFLNLAGTFLLKSNFQYCKILHNTEINF